MQGWDRVTEDELREWGQILLERGHVVAQGIQALRLLRIALERAHQNSGAVVEWDPGSSIDLSGWFGVTSLSSMRYAIAGGALGLLICGFTNRAGLGTALGAAVGALVGAMKGHEAVRSGWRLRSYIDAQGTVCVEVKALPPQAG